MSKYFNSISTLWMYLSLSVNIHQSYRFKMNVKLFVDNVGFIRIIPNIFLFSILFLISVHFRLGLSRSFFETWSLLKGSLWLFWFCHFAGKILEYFVNFGLKIFEQLPQLYQLAGFDDNFSFAKSFSFSSNFFFVKHICYQKSI